MTSRTTPTTQPTPRTSFHTGTCSPNGDAADRDPAEIPLSSPRASLTIPTLMGIDLVVQSNKCGQWPSRRMVSSGNQGLKPPGFRSCPSCRLVGCSVSNECWSIRQLLDFSGLIIDGPAEGPPDCQNSRLRSQRLGRTVEMRQSKPTGHPTLRSERSHLTRDTPRAPAASNDSLVRCPKASSVIRRLRFVRCSANQSHPRWSHQDLPQCLENRLGLYWTLHPAVR